MPTADKQPPTDFDTIAELIASHTTWYHQIELAPGLVTPGVNQSADGLAKLDALGLPEDCTGMRVLDIGCMDGFFSFAMEQRGAEVTALDYASPEYSGFSIARSVLGSAVEHHTCNVYDITVDRFGKFDLVLFLGVLYHLRNPMMALDQIRTVVADGGEIFVETQLTTDSTLLATETPSWEFFPADSHNGDRSNMWAPNMAGLRAFLEECEYDVTSTADYGTRGYAHALAKPDHSMEYFRSLDSSAGFLAPDAPPPPDDQSV